MILSNRFLASKTGLCLFVVGVVTNAQPVNSFLQHNLVSDLAGVADFQDKNLVNPWGNGFGSTPFWVGDNVTGLSTLYAGDGTPNKNVIVSIPGPNGAATGGKVTGVIFNAASSNSAAFVIPTTTKTPNFIFCGEDGILSGWSPTVDAAHAKVLVDNSASGADYTGCVEGGPTTAPLIFLANFSKATVDVVDSTGKLNPAPFNGPTAWVDQVVPAGYAPFNVAIINGLVYVTYAKQDSTKKLAVFGNGIGYVAVFDQTGNVIRTMIQQGALNAPWGITMAPATFGPFGGDLLVGNLGDGRINAFDPNTGVLAGTLNDATGTPISIQGLWAIAFGSGAQKEDPGTLYFTAGPGTLGSANDPLYSHGLLGSLQAAPSFTTNTVLNAGSLLAGPIAPNEWITIKGGGLSATNANWTVTGATLPTTTGGTSVTIDGEKSAASFVSGAQINVLVPADIPPGGQVQINVNNNGLASANINANVAFLAPSFFQASTVAGDNIIAATHANNKAINAASPALQGETIVLYGTGFGQTNPPIPNGQVVTAAAKLLNPPLIFIDGIQAQVNFAGLVAPGLYQFNVVVPTGVTRGGDALVIALTGDSVTQSNAFIPIG